MWDGVKINIFILLSLKIVFLVFKNFILEIELIWKEKLER